MAIAASLLVGCANTAENETESTAQETPTEESALGATETTEQTLPVENTSQPTEQVQLNTSVTSPKLNPAHGEPGHSCAIPVGAPLDGSGAQPQTQTITAPVATQPVAQPNFSTGSAPANGINPPHGEPGHDCAVAVGAPLPAK